VVPAQGRAQVSGGRRDICCRRRYRRSGGESSSLGVGGLRVRGSCCIPGPRGDQRSLRQGDKMEDSPGLVGHSCLDGEGEVEGDLLEVPRLEDRQVEEEDSCCSYCEEGGEAEGIG